MQKNQQTQIFKIILRKKGTLVNAFYDQYYPDVKTDKYKSSREKIKKITDQYPWWTKMQKCLRKC